MSLARSLISPALLAGSLGAWYSTHEDVSPEIPFEQKYDLPDTIAARSATHIPLNCATDAEDAEPVRYEPEGENPLSARSGEKCWVNTADINFNENFTLDTGRYTIVRGKDYGLSQSIGWLGSFATKLYFWDSDMGAGLDAERTKSVLAMLENHPEIEDLLVRVNHNAVWEDLGRLFEDPQITERNSFAARAFFGLLGSFFHELFAELARGDYYNPMTQTAVLYSNVDAVSAHEIGHHIDFQRFSSDWEYASTAINPGMLVDREYRASQNAQGLIGTGVENQYERFLLPALLTYLLASWKIARANLNNEAGKKIWELNPSRRKVVIDSEGNRKHSTEITPEMKAVAATQVGFLDVARRYARYGMNGAVGVAAFNGVYTSQQSEVLALGAAFLAIVVADLVEEAVGSRVYPHYHEKPNR